MEAFGLSGAIRTFGSVCVCVFVNEGILCCSVLWLFSKCVCVCVFDVHLTQLLESQTQSALPDVDRCDAHIPVSSHRHTNAGETIRHILPSGPLETGFQQIPQLFSRNQRQPPDGKLLSSPQPPKDLLFCCSRCFITKTHKIYLIQMCLLNRIQRKREK